MAGLAWTWPRGRERWRKPALIGASAVAHVLMLGFLAVRALGLPDPAYVAPAQPIYVRIEPRPLLPGEQPRARPTPVQPDTGAEGRPASSEQVAVGPLTFRNPFRNRDEAAPADRPSPPAPRFVAPPQGAPAGPSGGAQEWTVRPETMGDRVGRGLRTGVVGCATPDLLSEAERVVCDDRFARRAATAAPITGTGDPERDARFEREGRRALAQYEERRRPLAGGVGVVGPQDGPGSNFGMGVAGAHLDPSFRPDSTTNVRTDRDRDREIEED